MKSLRSSALSVSKIILIRPTVCPRPTIFGRSKFLHPIAHRPLAHQHVRLLHSTASPLESPSSDLRLSSPDENIKLDEELGVSEPSDTAPPLADTSSFYDKTSRADGRINSGLVIESNDLPLSCPGCGAYSQSSTADEPGYYSADRNDVQLWLARQKDIKSSEDEEADIMIRSLASLDPALLDSLGISKPGPSLLLHPVLIGYADMV